MNNLGGQVIAVASLYASDESPTPRKTTFQIVGTFDHMIALAPKQETARSLTWIAERLKMGARSSVSRATTPLARETEANRKLKKQDGAILRRSH